MIRPFAALALVFAAVIIGAGTLMVGTERGDDGTRAGISPAGEIAQSEVFTPEADARSTGRPGTETETSVSELQVEASAEGVETEIPAVSIEPPARVSTLSVAAAPAVEIATPAPVALIEMLEPRHHLQVSAVAEPPRDEIIVANASIALPAFWLIPEITARPVEVDEAAGAIAPAEREMIVRAEIPFPDAAPTALKPVVATAADPIDAPIEVTGSLPSPLYAIIRRGDSLWRLSRRNYGEGIRYEAILEANRELIENPHLIFPGQVFVLPQDDRSSGLPAD